MRKVKKREFFFLNIFPFNCNFHLIYFYTVQIFREWIYHFYHLKKQMNIKLFSPSLWALSPQFTYSIMQTFRLLVDLKARHPWVSWSLCASWSGAQLWKSGCLHTWREVDSGDLLTMFSNHPSLHSLWLLVVLKWEIKILSFVFLEVTRWDLCTQL